jgi:hypothetical protein
MLWSLNYHAGERMRSVNGEMAVLDPVIRGIQYDLDDLKLVRGRRGCVRGTVWVEWAGCTADGARLTLRLRHRFERSGGTVLAGLLLSQPLSRGGKTVGRGEAVYAYTADMRHATERVVEDIQVWLERVKQRVSVVGPEAGVASAWHDQAPVWLPEREIEKVRRFGFDLRAAIVIDTGESLEAWTTVGPTRSPDTLGCWPLGADGRCEIVVLRGRYRGRVFRVEPLALTAALGRGV